MQGQNQDLLHCRQILYCLSDQSLLSLPDSPSILIHPEVGAVTFMEDHRISGTYHHSPMTWGLQGGIMTCWQRYTNQTYCAMLCYSLSLLQGIFPTHGLNPGLPHQSGQPIPSLEELPNPRTEPRFPALQADSFNTRMGGLSLLQRIFPTLNGEPE